MNTESRKEPFKILQSVFLWKTIGNRLSVVYLSPNLIGKTIVKRRHYLTDRRVCYRQEFLILNHYSAHDLLSPY